MKIVYTLLNSKNRNLSDKIDKMKKILLRDALEFN